jgi:1,4-alpha-glucan branching enzyme
MAKKKTPEAEIETKKPAAKKAAVKKSAKPKSDAAAAKKTPAKKTATKKVVAQKTISGDAKKASAIEITMITSSSRVIPFSKFSEFDIALFQSGKHFRLYNHFGAHEEKIQGIDGTYFAVWAPNAKSVSVIGNFNFWNTEDAVLLPRWDGSGIWEGFVPECKKGEVYKYSIVTLEDQRIEKSDPFAFFCELRPRTASITWNHEYKWNDNVWMKFRSKQNALDAPFSVYEVHLGSWMRSPENPEEFLSYDHYAVELVNYVKKMGFTHVEFMPIMEFPFDGSWGYQLTGYFAPTSRFGNPQQFMHLVDRFHQEGIGVIVDWVPAHFPGDAHGLYEFDGTHLYEHADPKKGFHPDWKSYIFNLGRNEVRAFMISNALFWLDIFHIDGLRVDAVASMLYLDYSREAGEWIPNEFGGRENLENVSFLKELNETVYSNFPSVQTIAEESTSWPGVSRPVYSGGLGFGMKWMMGWMNDSLRYFERDPYYRQHHQNEITFSLVYAFTENFMLPLSHDEVVHGKKSLLYKMPGDEWQKFANLRLLYLWMFTHPGTKLLFQGGEFGQTAEWNHEQSLDWHLLQYAPHQGIQKFIQQLNHTLKSESALYQLNFSSNGFEWIDNTDHQSSVFSFIRKGNSPEDVLVVVFNLTPVPRKGYRVGLPFGGIWKEILNSDNSEFWGSGAIQGDNEAGQTPWQGMPYSSEMNLPPLGGFILKPFSDPDNYL